VKILRPKYQRIPRRNLKLFYGS